MKNLAFILSLLLLSSCATVYFPNAHNAPMFSKKGEFQSSATVGVGFTADVQTAYAVSNHVGVMVNGQWAFTAPDANSYNGNNLFGEAGIGYYTHFKNLYFDIWGGYGGGKINVYDSTHNSNTGVQHHNWTNGNYQRFFIQPSLALKGKHTHYGFVQRFSLVNTSGMYGMDDNRMPLAYTKQCFFYEPAFVLKQFIKQKFFFNVQVGLSIPLESLYGMQYMPFQLSGGVGMRLNSK